MAESFSSNGSSDFTLTAPTITNFESNNNQPSNPFSVHQHYNGAHALSPWPLGLQTALTYNDGQLAYSEPYLADMSQQPVNNSGPFPFFTQASRPLTCHPVQYRNGNVPYEQAGMYGPMQYSAVCSFDGLEQPSSNTFPIPHLAMTDSDAVSPSEVSQGNTLSLIHTPQSRPTASPPIAPTDGGGQQSDTELAGANIIPRGFYPGNTTTATMKHPTPFLRPFRDYAEGQVAHTDHVTTLSALPTGYYPSTVVPVGYPCHNLPPISGCPVEDWHRQHVSEYSCPLHPFFQSYGYGALQLPTSSTPFIGPPAQAPNNSVPHWPAHRPQPLLQPTHIQLQPTSFGNAISSAGTSFSSVAESRDNAASDTPKPRSSTVPSQGASTATESFDKDAELVRLRKYEGLSYHAIQKRLGLSEAEPTLRGRYRNLTKPKNERVRAPKWQDIDKRLLMQAVQVLRQPATDNAGTTTRNGGASGARSRTPWKKVAEYIRDNRGSYHFGPATCKIQWEKELGIYVEKPRRARRKP